MWGARVLVSRIEYFGSQSIPMLECQFVGWE